jgi:hypothetical protein
MKDLNELILKVITIFSIYSVTIVVTVMFAEMLFFFENNGSH